MASTKALERAAQAWCTGTTGHVEMNAVLATAFAEILDAECELAVRFGYEQHAHGDVLHVEDAVDAWYVQEGV